MSQPPSTNPLLRVLSLGAGVQSTTLALMAAHGEIGPMPDCAIFADTQSEPLAVYDHLRWLMSPNVLPFPVHVITAGNLGAEIRLAASGHARNDARPPFFIKNPDGSRGILRRQCTGDYKIDPIHKMVRQLIGLKPRQRAPKTVVVEQWIGISTDESHRMKPSLHPMAVNRWPLIEQEMSRHSCLRWLENHDYPRPPKSACTFCPYRSDLAWRNMRDTDPVAWAEALEIDATIRSPGYVGLVGEAYIHDSLTPLAEVDLSTAAERGQPDLFGNECDGMCGV